MPMRLAPLLALLLAAPLAAQTVPDTTTASRYMPLDVGTEWHYATEDFMGLERTYSAARVVAESDSVVGGVTYTVVRSEQYDGEQAPFTWTGTTHELVRFDPDRAMPVELDGAGEVPWNPSWAYMFDCRFDSDFGATALCESGLEGRVFGGPEEQTPFGGTTAIKTIEGVPPLGLFYTLGADIGMLSAEASESDYGYNTDLRFARIGGETYGTPIPGLPLHDPTPAEAYVPLGVGNVWQYQSDAIPTTYRVEAVRRDTLIGGETYGVVWSQGFDDVFSPTGPPGETYLRVDPAQRLLVGWSRATGDQPSPDTPCPLDVPWSAPKGPAVLCEGWDGQVYEVSGGPAGPPGPSFATKGFSRFGGIRFGAGVGRLSRCGDGPAACMDLAHASVAGSTLGERVEGLLYPDLTPTEAYFPFAVGNVWEYEVELESGGRYSGPAYVRSHISTTLALSDTTYAVLESETFYGTGERIDGEIELVRFDPRLALAVERVEGGGEEPWALVTPDVGPPFFPYSRPLFCRADSDFGTTTPCVFGGEGDVFGSPDEPTGLGTFRTAVKTIYSVPPLGASYALAAGLGVLTDGFSETGNGYLRELRFARIDGAEYGTPIEAIRVGNEDTPRGPALALTAAPNPTSGALTLSLSTPTLGAITLEAFDAVGRRVLSREVQASAGPTDVQIDTSGWAPGLYLVRAAAGGESQTVRLVRR